MPVEPPSPPRRAWLTVAVALVLLGGAEPARGAESPASPDGAVAPAAAGSAESAPPDAPPPTEAPAPPAASPAAPAPPPPAPSSTPSDSPAAAPAPVPAGALLAATAAPDPAPPHDAFTLEFGLRAGMSYGHVHYRYSFTADGGALGPIEATSDLRWPADFPVAGLSAALETSGGVRLEAVFDTNLAHPLGRFADSDYLAVPEADVPRTRFSHTTSTAHARHLSADLGALAPLGGTLGPSVRLGGGLDYRCFVFEGEGAHGWQLDTAGNPVEIAIPNDVLGIRIAVHELAPSARGRFELPLGPVLLRADARALFTYSYLFDDHVLRNKDGRAHTFGLGGGGATEVMLTPPLRPLDHFIFGVGGRADYRHAWGRFRQRYYADDPGLQGDQTGADIPDVDITLDSLSLGVYAFVRAAL